MQKSIFLKIWDLLYPLGMYYTVQLIGIVILESTFPFFRTNSLAEQLVVTLAVLPVLYLMFFRPDQKLREDKSATPKLLPAILLAGAFFSIALNNLIGYLKLSELSPSYQQVNQTFFSSGLFIEVTALCFVIPAAEELLYRGILYGRLKWISGRRTAALVSALIFGLVHVNLVQFIYAFLFGLFLVFVYEMTGSIVCSILMHMAANGLSVLRAETNLFEFMNVSGTVSALVTILLFAGFVLLIFLTLKMSKMTKK